jgi:hypothetical protein
LGSKNVKHKYKNEYVFARRRLIRYVVHSLKQSRTGLSVEKALKIFSENQNLNISGVTNFKMWLVELYLSGSNDFASRTALAHK